MENTRGWPVDVFDKIVRDYNITDKHAVECLRRAWNIAASRIDSAVCSGYARQEDWRDALWDAQVGLVYALETAMAVGAGLEFQEVKKALEYGEK